MRLCLSVCVFFVLKSVLDCSSGGSVCMCVFVFSGTCCNVTAPETSCMQAANIKRFAGGTAVGCIAVKHEAPGLPPLGLSGKELVNKIMSGATYVLK